MNERELVQVLGADPDAPPARAAVQRIDPRMPPPWRAVAVALACHTAPAVIGIAGGQGAGKSTLAAALVQALPGRACALSLDDFYRTRAERRELARAVHPLLATRGPPGSHEPQLAVATIDALLASHTPVRVPRFDKGADDRAPDALVVETPVDHVVLEGWCLGALPEPDPTVLAEPVNVLERVEDPDGTWRRHVDAALAHYLPLWRRIGFWIYLEVPDLAAVARWRGEQERALPQEQRMDGTGLARFIAHYERITERMRITSPPRAHWHLELDGAHGVARAHRNATPLEFRKRSD